MNIYQYYPEVDYWFTQAMLSHMELTEYRINLPESFDITVNQYYQAGSFIELLFRDVYPYDTYTYTFKEQYSSILPKKIQDRILIKNTMAKTYLSNVDSTEQPYILSNTEFDLLDQLLLYKNGTTPDLTLFDTTNGLDTKLSYYMYYYMDTMVNRSYEWLLNTSDINDLYPTPTFLDNLYEVYILNLVHTEIKNWTFLLDSKSLHLYPVRSRVYLTSAQLDDGKVILDRPIPYDINASTTKMYINGELQDLSTYNITVVADETIIQFDNNIHKLTENNILIFDYYAAINTYEHQTTEEPTIQVKGSI